MDLINATRMQAAYTQGLQVDGRELLVVVIKGTFQIPEWANQAPELAEEQVPLVFADTFTGEPGFSAPIYESDFAPRKPRCDVLLLGTAHAREGTPVNQIPVGLKVGDFKKVFRVVGDRVWQAGIGGIHAGPPAPFLQMPISYDRAFGGLDDFHVDPEKHGAYRPNPVGLGYHQILSGNLVNGSPMPNTEESERSITNPAGDYRPMSFGPVGRSWEPRYRLAGTYDQNWTDNIFPFLPPDFDEAYFQAAPPDQQIPYLQGGEEIVLANLTPSGRNRFWLPKIDMPVVFFPKKGGKEESRAVIDTLIVEPDSGRFTITWRIARPLKKSMFEVSQVLVGEMSRAWWRALELGKTYYPSLEHLAKANRPEAEEES
ncbi:MAG: DUF2169 domain-containing protein [Gammaproteobacteria bacterium HGW-Gammaproteobacteria-10]|nr:MAG: DUF2169 domain-containing protein [Gammaproteobacteria bacterium HGW-Gammaproteobacteria-10]